MSRRVLMVDDEEDLVWSTARTMARERPDLAFEPMTDPEEALAAVRSNPPDVLITDLRMPKMSGLELLLNARRSAPDLPVIVVTAYGSPEVRTEVQRSHSVQYLEKPLCFQSLLEAVDRALAPSTGFSGAISLPMLPDLIQIYALSQMTGTLRIRRGSEEGSVWFDNGQIVHAVCGTLVGAEAFYRLLTWQGGGFDMGVGAVATCRSISSSWQELLVEGCRLLDEGGRIAVETTGKAALHTRIEELWTVLRPRVREAAPEALVVAASLEAAEAIVLQGTSDASAWPEPLSGVVSLVRRISGAAARGALECVTSDYGVALSWDVERDVAVVFGDGWMGRSGPSRFRSNVARWRDACRDWLGNA